MTNGLKDGFPTMQASIAGTPNCAPPSSTAKNINDVIDPVLRFETHHQGGIAMLFKNHGGRKRGLEAMRLRSPHHFAE